LIVDLRLPEVDSVELQEQLRTRVLGFPMIVITAHADVPLAVRPA
jgi:FixJ family two-component response regulator